MSKIKHCVNGIPVEFKIGEPELVMVSSIEYVEDYLNQLKNDKNTYPLPIKEGENLFCQSIIIKKP